MQEENIVFEDVTSLIDFKGLKQPQSIEEEKEYASLQNELLDKCNPNNFVSENSINKKHFDIANEIYAKLRNTKNISESELIKLRNRAIEELGVHISTKKLFKELTDYFNTKIYISMEPYNAERVAKAGYYYEKVLMQKRNILELEKIKAEASEFIKEREVELQEEKRLKEEEEKKLKEKDKEIDKSFYSFCIILIILIILIIFYSNLGDLW